MTKTTTKSDAISAKRTVAASVAPAYISSSVMAEVQRASDVAVPSVNKPDHVSTFADTTYILT